MGSARIPEYPPPDEAMIGRFARGNAPADVRAAKVLQVTTAGILVAAAAILEYGTVLGGTLTVGLSVASLCFTGLPIIWGAAKGLLRLRTNVDELVSIAIVASVILGEWISAAVVAWIMVLGSVIEQYTSQRARRHIEALSASGPDAALLIGDDGRVRRVRVDELQPGQEILARPGDVIAADGVIEEGESDVDESMLTGEGMPADKTAGDRVLSGSVNGSGSLRIRVERAGRDSTHGKIVELVREAERHRAPVLRAAQAYARWFTPSILTLAGAVWVITGDPLRAVTMLIVGCPCAFVLATPTAIVAALGRASRRGLLVKGGQYLEAAAGVEVLALDKTGTLTSGNCRVGHVVPLDGRAPEELLRRAAGLEAAADHPLARAVVEKAAQAGIEVTGVSIRRQAGLGVSEIKGHDNRPWHIGNKRLMERRKVPIRSETQRQAEALEAEGYRVLFLSEEDELRGLLAIEDEIRPEALPTLANLRGAGYRDIYMLTGDAETSARRVGEDLEISPHQVRAQLLPDDKYRFIESMERRGRRVCYVGDGTNDGPALAVASVGVSIGSRENNVALETANVVLMRDGLAPFPFLFELSKATTRTINQNLILFGLLVNAAMLLLSGLGFLTPILGAAGHNAGSVAVVLNSARLLRFRSRAKDSIERESKRPSGVR
jgi:Cd2+/Zn2+-exporting ATPase